MDRDVTVEQTVQTEEGRSENSNTLWQKVQRINCKNEDQCTDEKTQKKGCPKKIVWLSNCTMCILSVAVFRRVGLSIQKIC